MSPDLPKPVLPAPGAELGGLARIGRRGPRIPGAGGAGTSSLFPLTPDC